MGAPKCVLTRVPLGGHVVTAVLGSSWVTEGGFKVTSGVTKGVTAVSGVTGGVTAASGATMGAASPGAL